MHEIFHICVDTLHFEEKTWVILDHIWMQTFL